MREESQKPTLTAEALPRVIKRVLSAKSRPKTERATAFQLHDLASDVAKRVNQENFRLDYKSNDPIYESPIAVSGRQFSVTGKEAKNYTAKLATTSEELMDWGDSTALQLCVGNGSYAVAAAEGTSYLLGVFQEGEIYGCIEVTVEGLEPVQAKLRRNSEMPRPVVHGAVALLLQAVEEIKNKAERGEPIQAQ